MSDKIREMFESGTQWEGSCAKYADGDYVNEVQQEQWIGFKDGMPIRLTPTNTCASIKG